jgi:hypothetical protein
MRNCRAEKVAIKKEAKFPCRPAALFAMMLANFSFASTKAPSCF